MQIENFEKDKELAETYYKQIGKIYSPVLKTEVHFNSDGFHHLRYDNTRSERSKKEQLNKFKCLKFAAEILKKSTTFQEYRTALQRVGKPDNKGLYKTTRAEYYAFTAIGENKKIRVKVIVRRLGDGNFHFWSVMPYWIDKKITENQSFRQLGSKRLEDE